MDGWRRAKYARSSTVEHSKSSRWLAHTRPIASTVAGHFFFAHTHLSLSRFRPTGPLLSPAPSSMRFPLCLVAAAVPALAGIKDVFWDITYVENVNPDGLFERRAIGVNGTWP